MEETSGRLRKGADWGVSMLNGIPVFLCRQGVTGRDGARGERGHFGNPVKENKNYIMLF